MKLFIVKHCIKQCLMTLILVCVSHSVSARDLEEVKKAGVLRHLGIPYANFVFRFSEDDQVSYSGLDIELMQGFAQYIGVDYQFIAANWGNVFGKLTGQHGKFINHQVKLGHRQEIEGDVMAHGVTILDWRQQLVDFSDDYFPSTVWLVAKTYSDLTPITPTGLLKSDIVKVKGMLCGKNVLAMKQSCLDPDLYNLHESKVNIIWPTQELQLNEMVPAMLNGEAEATLLDLADSLIALQKWPNQIKVIGPISEEQRMGVGFRKNSPKLRQAFNDYLQQIRRDGTYLALVEKYYPSVFNYYENYFESVIEKSNNEH